MYDAIFSIRLSDFVYLRKLGILAGDSRPKERITLCVYLAFHVLMLCKNRLYYCSFSTIFFRLGYVSDRSVPSSHVRVICIHHSTEEGRDELVH